MRPMFERSAAMLLMTIEKRMPRKRGCDLQHDKCEDEPNREVQPECVVKLSCGGVRIANARSRNEDSRKGEPESTVRGES